MKAVFDSVEGNAPLLISMPHSGTGLPEGMLERMTPEGRDLADTDWHVPRLYRFADQMGASVLRARYSRYVIDLNRPPDGAALYPGHQETSLCPDSTFAGEPIYQAGLLPDQAQVSDRLERYWRPYHDALSEKLQSIREQHGFAVLWDAHSIASRVPRLFKGRLPDLNLGTADGVSCERRVADAVYQVMSESDYTAVRDGRFKGGYITRAYGAPARGIHALQMELAQSAYMDEDGSEWAPALAAPLSALLQRMLEAALRAAAS